MKLWEAVSAFRGYPAVLAEVLSGHADYGERFRRFAQLVIEQDRVALDAELPIELTRELARRCDLRFELASGTLRAASVDSNDTLSALEVHDRFGGAVIEEVLEYGSATPGAPHPC